MSPRPRPRPRTAATAAVVALGLVATLVACTPEDDADVPAADTSTPSSSAAPNALEITADGPPPADAVTADPAWVDAAVEAVPDLADQALEAGVPGLAIAVVHDDEVLLLEGYGVRELGGVDVVDADTVFQVASVSKPIGATVVATQVSDGVVGWDDPVTTHLPDFALVDP